MSSAPKLAKLDEGLVRLLDRRVLSAGGEPLPDRVVDEVLVSVVAAALRNALAAQRRKGSVGWHVGKDLNERLLGDLQKCVREGGMVDALRLVAIIHAREHLYGPEA